MFQLGQIIKERARAGLTDTPSEHEDAKDFAEAFREFVQAYRGQNSTGHPLSEDEKKEASLALDRLKQHLENPEKWANLKASLRQKSLKEDLEKKK